MANTYSQLYVQMIFAVKYRHSLISSENKSRIEQYICGVASNIDCKPLSIYCNPDHVHLFVSMKPKISCSEAIQKIKSSTTLFINRNGLMKNHFEWQTGFGVFSYGKSQTDAVCNYIKNQGEHHRHTTFREEYIALLKAFEVEYDEKYLFDFSLLPTEADDR
ncbi:MAG: IS200/IS605 family transposase [Tannerellaceae bacterium]|nr:IS200/IS605 family transposase [Tannerellaceae bacterium]